MENLSVLSIYESDGSGKIYVFNTNRDDKHGFWKQACYNRSDKLYKYSVTKLNMFNLPNEIPGYEVFVCYSIINIGDITSLPKLIETLERNSIKPKSPKLETVNYILVRNKFNDTLIPMIGKDIFKLDDNFEITNKKFTHNKNLYSNYREYLGLLESVY